MKVGYASDWTKGSTVKYEIIDETISGKYVVRVAQVKMKDVRNNDYLATALLGLFLRDKSEFSNICEEEINA